MWLINRLVMGGISQGRLNLGLVKRPELSDKTYLVGYGSLLVCSSVPLLGTVITQRWTRERMNTDDTKCVLFKMYTLNSSVVFVSNNFAFYVNKSSGFRKEHI